MNHDQIAQRPLDVTNAPQRKAGQSATPSFRARIAWLRGAQEVGTFRAFRTTDSGF